MRDMALYTHDLHCDAELWQETDGSEGVEMIILTIGGADTISQPAENGTLDGTSDT